MLTFTRMQRSGLLVILMLTTSEAIETKNKIKDHEMSMKFYDSAKGLKGKVCNDENDSTPPGRSPAETHWEKLNQVCSRSGWMRGCKVSNSESNFEEFQMWPRLQRPTDSSDCEWRPLPGDYLKRRGFSNRAYCRLSDSYMLKDGNKQHFVETFKTIFQQKVDKFLEHCTQVAPSDPLSWLKDGFLQFLDHRCKRRLEQARLAEGFLRKALPEAEAESNPVYNDEKIIDFTHKKLRQFLPRVKMDEVRELFVKMKEDPSTKRIGISNIKQALQRNKQVITTSLELEDSKETLTADKLGMLDKLLSEAQKGVPQTTAVVKPKNSSVALVEEAYNSTVVDHFIHQGTQVSLAEMHGWDRCNAIAFVVGLLLLAFCWVAGPVAPAMVIAGLILIGIAFFNSNRGLCAPPKPEPSMAQWHREHPPSRFGQKHQNVREAHHRHTGETTYLQKGDLMKGGQRYNPEFDPARYNARSTGYTYNNQGAYRRTGYGGY